jgi:hypothetical protein
MSRPLLKFLAIPGIILTGHSSYVIYKRYESYDRVTRTNKNPLASDFRTGAIDDRVMDNLNTGDLILFQRRWYYHHLPIGLTILLYRHLFQTEFDHFGIVMVDKNGRAGVLENTFFHGLQFRPFPDRISYSQARVVNLIPIVPHDRPNQVENLYKEREQLIKTTNGEWTELILSCLEKYKIQYLSMGEQSKDVYLCPNLQLLSRFYDVLGIQLVPKKGEDKRNLCLQEISNRSIKLENKANKNEKISYFYEDILVRVN